MRGYWDRRLMVLSEHNGGGGGGAGGSGGGQGGGDNGGAGGGGNNQQQQQRPPWADEFGEGNFDADRAWQTIQNLRNSERTLKTERQQLQGRVKEFETAGQQGQTELQKLQQRLENMERENTEFKERARLEGLRTQVAAEARAAGAHNPDDVFALMDQSAMDIDDSGKIRNVTALLNHLRREKAYLFTGRPVDAGAGRNGGNGGSGNQGGGTFNDSIRGAFGRS